MGVVLATLLPACCVFNGAKHPAEKQTLPETLERETVALDRWLGVVGEDEEGEEVIGDVDPEKDAKAELRAYCTGVWVSKDTILTAEHCVDDLGRPEEDPRRAMIRELLGMPKDRWDPTGQPLWISAFGEVSEGAKKLRGSHRATVLAVDWEHDLALVKVNKEEMATVAAHPVATLAREGSLHVGDDVHIVGHTVGMWWSYTRGWVAQVRPGMDGPDGDKKYDCVQVSAPVWFGNSGGGAFNANGELIGISSFIRKVPNMSFFVDTEHLRTFLAHNVTR